MTALGVGWRFLNCSRDTEVHAAEQLHKQATFDPRAEFYFVRVRCWRSQGQPLTEN